MLNMYFASKLFAFRKTSSHLRKFSSSIGKFDDKLLFSSGLIGHLAQGNALCSGGGTLVHTAICTSTLSSDALDTSLPLTVELKSRDYASGNIPENFKRRERHGSEQEILAARIIDRSIRPLFPKNYLVEIQLTSTIHSVDSIHDPVVIAVNGASYALMNSNVIWNGPIGCVRVGLINKQLKVNPTASEMETSELDLLFSGTYDRVLM